ncbi:MAG: chloride channel protein [Phycisphaerae bacterium]|nr:chloride channel protein [Phycisphaerae bacterium]
MLQTLRRHVLQRVLWRFRLGDGWPLLTAAGAMGALMGLVAVGFMAPIHLLEGWLERESLLSGSIPWLVVFAPVAGAMANGVILALVPNPFRGHGVSQVIWSVARNRSRLPVSLALRQWLGSTATIGSGGSAGPEGPIVTIGSVVGSNMARLIRADASQRTLLLGCGAAAGLAAVFSAPLTGVFFVLEVLLRDFSLRTFAPVVLASVLGATTAQSILQSNAPVMGIDPEVYSGVRFGLVELPAFVVVGAACGACSVLFTISMHRATIMFRRIPMPQVLMPAVGALLLAALGVAWLQIAGEASGQPPFYSNGYRLIESLCSGAVQAGHATGWLLVMLTSLLGLKIVATSFTLGSGGTGGLFAPSLVCGGLIGALVATITNSVDALPDIHPALCIVTGMGAFVAGSAHAPLAGLMLSYEITRDYTVMLPLMLAVVTALAVARALKRESLYTEDLITYGLRLGQQRDWSRLERTIVGDLMLEEPIRVSRSDSADALIARIKSGLPGDAIVLGADGRYEGMVLDADVRPIVAFSEIAPLLTIEELVRRDVPRVSASDSLDECMRKFGRTSSSSLPVVDRVSGECSGVVQRTTVLEAYSHDSDA